jgi:hypothetical protein
MRNHDRRYEKAGLAFCKTAIRGFDSRPRLFTVQRPRKRPRAASACCGLLDRYYEPLIGRFEAVWPAMASTVGDRESAPVGETWEKEGLRERSRVQIARSRYLALGGGVRGSPYSDNGAKFWHEPRDPFLLIAAENAGTPQR